MLIRVYKFRVNRSYVSTVRDLNFLIVQILFFLAGILGSFSPFRFGAKLLDSIFEVISLSMK